MKRIGEIIILSIAFCAMAQVTASGADGLSINRLDSVYSLPATIAWSSLEYNPAAMLYKQSFSLTQLSATGDFLNSDEATMIQNGTGHSLVNISADSYYRLSSHSVVWGNAAYKAGSVKDVKWNNTSDYERLAPYTLGDSVGGNLTQQQYIFSGGYAAIANAWSWGANATYKAAVDYRSRDPRLKIIVSDLNLRLGIGYSPIEELSLGMHSKLNVYNMDSELEFYNPINSIRTYALTGLGTVYSRFSGSSCENTAYSGLGWNVGFFALKNSLSGLSHSVVVDFGRDNIKQILKDFNNLDLTSTATYNLSAIYTVHSARWGAKLSGEWRRRLGNENLFGSSVGNNYVKISSRQFYYSDYVVGGIDVPVSYGTTVSGTIEFSPSCKIVYGSENYRRPSRQLSYRAWIPSMDIRWRKAVSQRSIVQCGAFGDYRVSKMLSQKLTGLDTSSSIGSMVVHNFEMLTSGASTVGALVTLDYMASRALDVVASASFTSRHINGHGNSRGVTISIGIKI